MKLSFKATLLFYLLCSPSFAQAIIMSGEMTPHEQTAYKRVTASLIGRNNLVKWQKDNPKCERVKGHLIQICWKKEHFYIVYQKRRMLKNSIARLVEMRKTQKAFNEKASL